MNPHQLETSLARFLGLDGHDAAQIGPRLEVLETSDPILALFVKNLIRRFVPGERTVEALELAEKSSRGLGHEMAAELDRMQAADFAADKPKRSQAKLMNSKAFIEKFRRGRGNRRTNGLMSISRCEDLVQEARRNAKTASSRKKSRQSE